MKTDYNPAVWKPTQKLAVLICLLWGQSLSGYGANLFTVISPLPSLSARADGPYTIGNSITVGNQALVVDKLGAMDTTSTGLGTDGFVAGSVQVGIWNAGGILLASATVTSADPLDGSYRYHALPAPITLAANTTYLIGARVGAGIEWFLDANLNPVVSADAGIGLGQAGYATGGALAAPVNNGGNNSGRWAAANASFSTNAAPVAPSILNQPQSAIRMIGDDIGFSVMASGVPAPTFQWYLNATNLLAGATNATLVLTNVGPVQAGSYAVVVTNALGSITSSNAVLTVFNPPLDTTNDLLVHLKLDETSGLVAADATTNGNNGALNGFPGDDSQWIHGRINGAVHFSGPSGGVQEVIQVTDPGMFDFSNSRVFTLSAWFRGSASQVEGAAVICKGGGGGGEQYCFDVYQGKFRFYCWDTNHNAAVLNTPAELNGTWQHVVVVFSSPLSHLKFYLNGVAVASGTPPASIIANAHDVTVGSRELSASSGYTLGLDGEIDEVRIYARALSPADVQAIYNEAPLGVAFIQQPSGAALFAGDTLRLAPAVEGTRPIAYQWLKSGTNLAGATLRELAITNVVPADSGDYQLVASNAVNTITSAVARVTVMAVTSVTNGLAGYWRFDEPAGSTAADWSGNNNPGTINNSLGDSGQWTSGKVGGALSFRGPGLGDDYVVIPTWPKAINGTMTLSAWVWADARPDRARIACGGSGVDSIGQFLLTQSTGSSDLRGYAQTSARITVSAQEGLIFPTNSWQHVVLVANGTTNHIYRNGIEVGSVAYDGTLFNPTNALSIGARLTADDSAAESGWWQGKIDDVAYWTRGLSASEVFELFAAGSVGSPVTAADGFRNATPIIVTQPQGGTVYLHEPLPLQVTATGVAPLAYQWWKDGALFFDATNRVFSNPSVEFSAAGNYAVVIMAGNGGSVTSATAAITVSAPAPQPDFGMVMHLKFDETAGSMAADSTTNANNGTLVNFSNPNTNWVPGLFGNALAFLSGGINADAVTVPAQPNLDFGTNAFSLSLWAKGSPYQTASGGLLCKGVAPWESYCLDFYDGTYRFFVRNTAGLVTSAIAPGIMPNNQWQHVAVAYDPGVGQSSMYVDGMLVGAAMTADALFSGLDPLDIGARQGGGNYQYYWTGLLDDVRVYGRAITPLEVRALTYSGIPPELTIATGAGQVTVSWPLEALGYELQSSTNLVSAGWARVPNVTTNWLTLTPNGRQQYYRLQK